MPLSVEVSSVVDAPQKDVWERVSTLDGVNHELGPLLRMTAPAGARIDPASVPLGERWFRSRLLLFGVLPVDYDDLTLIAIEPGSGFHERSRMLSMRVWEHRRTLAQAPGGTLVTDSLSFVPRLPVARRLQRALVAATFRRRHRRLRAWFGRLDT
jgi:ligand-binding SRPBCC domain-containing protein